MSAFARGYVWGCVVGGVGALLYLLITGPWKVAFAGALCGAVVALSWVILRDGADR